MDVVRNRQEMSLNSIVRLFSATNDVKVHYRQRQEVDSWLPCSPCCLPIMDVCRASPQHFIIDSFISD